LGEARFSRDAVTFFRADTRHAIVALNALEQTQRTRGD
jgi:hypothetical protein